MKIDAPELAWLLNVANDFRKRKDGSELDDLPKSEPSEAEYCLVANAFNYSCEVFPSRKELYNAYNNCIRFSDFDDAVLYCEVMGLNKDHIGKLSYGWYAPLHHVLNEIANAFDSRFYVEYEDEGEEPDEDEHEAYWGQGDR